MVYSDSKDSTKKKEQSMEAKSRHAEEEGIEDSEPSDKDNILLNSLVENVLSDDKEEDLALQPPLNPSTAKSQQMIHLIQAIDRKVPLDDYAEQNQLDFDEVLDNLEHLIQRGTKLDISYFTDEVLGQEALDELFDYFDEVDGNVEKAFDEFYGIYQPEEIRLARLVWK